MRSARSDPGAWLQADRRAIAIEMEFLSRRKTAEIRALGRRREARPQLAPMRRARKKCADSAYLAGADVAQMRSARKDSSCRRFHRGRQILGPVDAAARQLLKSRFARAAVLNTSERECGDALRPDGRAGAHARRSRAAFRRHARAIRRSMQSLRMLAIPTEATRYAPTRIIGRSSSSMLPVARPPSARMWRADGPRMAGAASGCRARCAATFTTSSRCPALAY